MDRAVACAVRAAAEARATASRDLPTPLTVLTYQAVASFDPAGVDGDGGADAMTASDGSPSSHPIRRLSDRELLASLHPNGQRLLATLKAAGPATLVLDECHHLLEIWGRLLLAIVGELPDPRIIGLTATPPHMMTTEQAGLHQELFGAVDLEVSAPALVRDGHLAPYQELAWFTAPTPAEADYIGGQALRFAELRAGLLDPGFATVPFLAWLQQRVVERRAAGTERSCRGSTSPGISRPSRTPRSGCIATGCCRSPTARRSANSTGTRRPPRTGSR